MTRLPRITGPDAVRALHRAGWRVVRRRGSHVILRHDGQPGRAVVPVHAGATLKPKTLISILDQAGLTGDDLRDLL
jgi:predicted RNA binding protein YcfA (HicA-like mRNA interferase family)